MEPELPKSVRYVKNGKGGAWWDDAQKHNQIRAGWREVPPDVLVAADLVAAEKHVREDAAANKRRSDFNALELLLDRPSQHVWVAFEKGHLWWCTVHDDIEVNPNGNLPGKAHFWLKCARGWSNLSLKGELLAIERLPGPIGKTKGFRATVCKPGKSSDYLRVIRGDKHPDVAEAMKAKGAYERAVSKIVAQLHEKDFEVLIDLILSRTGWSKSDKVGGSTEGHDIIAENPSTDEQAFVQVKSVATQSDLDKYVGEFRVRRPQFDRLIFAVNGPIGKLNAPHDKSVLVWGDEKIAQLVVRLGLGDWVQFRV